MTPSTMIFPRGRKYVPLQFDDPVPVLMQVTSEWPIGPEVMPLLKSTWR